MNKIKPLQEMPVNLVQDIEKAHAMALASNELRTDAAHEKAIGKLLIDALSRNADPSQFEAQPTESMKGFGPALSGERYDAAVNSYAMNEARKRTGRVGTLADAITDTTPDYRVKTVISTQEAGKNSDSLNRQAEVAEQEAATQYEAEKLQDPALLNSSQGREAVAQELLRQIQ